ncbi:alpha/beta fold hydrolase [Paraburkholderia susongensis]|uniref:Pimeloyl-ACP methyl ester carboxylesterase n=1 Tax=Paraburkholderia susongensis TaxID=1515439 RepID=A0A1X7M3Z8_9BURK|nr:alpha/beta hydrolase [Paraburkholderia susongensis]SMG60825.1 Pimeloyl-ACP methyl ester carboxylesterase [Paraburkholderia susongensis]
MLPKRLLCAAVLCLCFAGAGALAQTTPAVPSAETPPAGSQSGDEPATQPAEEASAPQAPAPAPAMQAPPAATAAPTAAASAPNTPPAMPLAGPVRNIVLVHGAFVDGSSWNGVVAKLQQKGYHVSSVQNPLTSLADDVAATRRVLAREDGPVLLVGHSWGGVVITEVAANAPNVAGLVYVAALAPELHESAVDVMKHAAPMPAGQNISADANGFLWLDRAHYRADLAADVPETVTRVLAAAQVPIAAKAFNEPVDQVGWKEKPSWYVLTTKDRAVSPALQKQMAERIGAKVVPVASSHLAPVSHAGAVADAIDRAARELSRQQ